MSTKILVADDSENIRTVLQLNFEWKGYEVVAVTDGEQAIQVVEREHPDLIILDVMMPGKNGYQVCRRFKSNAETASIPVILLTARNQAEDVYWGKDCGADEYITKPFNTPDLEEAVQRLLSRSGCLADGVPVAPPASFREAVEDKIHGGYACGVCSFLLEPTAVMVHRQKYGEIRHKELIESVARGIETVLAQEGQGVIWEQEDDAFRVLIQSTVDRVEDIQERISLRCNEEILGSYDDSDRERNHVTSRDFRTGEEMRVPLATLRLESTRLYNQD